MEIKNIVTFLYKQVYKLTGHHWYKRLTKTRLASAPGDMPRDSVSIIGGVDILRIFDIINFYYNLLIIKEIIFI